MAPYLGPKIIPAGSISHNQCMQWNSSQQPCLPPLDFPSSALLCNTDLRPHAGYIILGLRPASRDQFEYERAGVDVVLPLESFEGDGSALVNITHNGEPDP
jgi:hypothetical protein